MQTFKPYVWLKKVNGNYVASYLINIPANYRLIGLQNPVDNTAAGVRIYKYYIEAQSGTTPSPVDDYTAPHTQPANISMLKIDVVDITNPTNPVKKGSTVTNYQDGDDLP